MGMDGKKDEREEWKEVRKDGPLNGLYVCYHSSLSVAWAHVDKQGGEGPGRLDVQGGE